MKRATHCNIALNFYGGQMDIAYDCESNCTHALGYLMSEDGVSEGECCLKMNGTCHCTDAKIGGLKACIEKMKKELKILEEVRDVE